VGSQIYRVQRATVLRREVIKVAVITHRQISVAELCKIATIN